MHIICILFTAVTYLYNFYHPSFRNCKSSGDSCPNKYFQDKSRDSLWIFLQRKRKASIAIIARWCFARFQFMRLIISVITGETWHIAICRIEAWLKRYCVWRDIYAFRTFLNQSSRLRVFFLIFCSNFYLVVAQRGRFFKRKKKKKKKKCFFSFLLRIAAKAAIVIDAPSALHFSKLVANRCR